MNNKYNNSIIYIIKCKDETIKDCYIGSTVDLCRRKLDHKTRCNNPNSKEYNYKKNIFIRDNGGTDNFYFDILENVNCNTRKELNKLEGEYIKLYKPSLNTNIAGRTKKEYKEDNKEYTKEYNKEYRELNKEYYKEYRELHKDKINEYKKDWYNNNKLQIKEKKKEYYEKNKDIIDQKIKCDCGAYIIKRGLKRHKKSKKCINILSKKE